jgi:glycosyltransferase involved in cell wall biosynthesis
MYTDAGAFGGAEVHLALLAGTIERHTPLLVLHDPHVAQSLRDRLPSDIEIRLLPRPQSVRDVFALGRLYAAFLSVRFRRRRVLMHCHLPTPYSAFFAIVLGRLAGLRVVCTEHIRISPSSRRVPRVRRLVNWAVAREIAVSSAVADSLVSEHGQDPARVTIIPNGIPLSRYVSPVSDPATWNAYRGASRDALGIPPDAFVVGSVGRLDPQKNYSLLLQAAGRARFGGDWFVVIAGEGKERALLEQRAAEWAISDRTKLPGHMDDIPRLLPALDVFVLSSLYEGLPLSLLEAMASGIPCIATAADGIKEVIIDGENGLLLPLGATAAELAERLSTLASDPDLRGRLATAALFTVNSLHDITSMTRLTEDLYEQVRSGRR